MRFEEPVLSVGREGPRTHRGPRARNERGQSAGGYRAENGGADTPASQPGGAEGEHLGGARRGAGRFSVPAPHSIGLGSWIKSTTEKTRIPAPTTTRPILAERTAKWPPIPTRNSTEAKRMVFLT